MTVEDMTRDRPGRITEDRHGRKAHTLPTVLDADRLLATAARRGVLVVRWVGGRHVAYMDGVEVEGWSPWAR